MDRWFDAEPQTAIVHPRIAHLYRTATGPVLGARRSTADEDPGRRRRP